MKAKKKKIDFTVRPRAATDDLPADADSWVRGDKPAGATVPLKRLTLNLPAELHKTFKGQCVREGITIQDKVHRLIERELADQPPVTPGELT